MPKERWILTVGKYFIAPQLGSWMWKQMCMVPILDVKIKFNTNFYYELAKLLYSDET